MGCDSTFRKPVSAITDRAKRYRANRCKKKAKRCERCGARQNLLIGHRDGNESNNAPSNLGTFCKSCNGVQAAEDKRKGRGVRTRQYNPRRKRNKGAGNLAQYVQAAVEHTRGAHDEGGRVIHETPKAKRREFAREIWFRRGHNPPQDIMREFRAGKLRDSRGKLVKDKKQAKAILLSELRAQGIIGARTNPSEADKLYRQFHGRGPDYTYNLSVPEMDPYSGHPEVAQFGQLVRFIVGEGLKLSGTYGDTVERDSDYPDSWAGEISFVSDMRKFRSWLERDNPPVQEIKQWLRQSHVPDLAGEPGGKQIYIVGGNQNIDAQLALLGADESKEILDLGYVYLVEYFTQKRFDHYEPVNYFHHFGEDSGVQPRLIYWKAYHRLQLVGGEYTIKPTGIHN